MPEYTDRRAVTRPRTMYNSHGSWATLGEIRELEVEDRENPFPDLSDLPDDTPAIWVAETPRQALVYLELAEEADRLMGDEPLTAKDRELLREISKVRVLPGDLLTDYDDDGGWLLLRPDDSDVRRE